MLLGIALHIVLDKYWTFTELSLGVIQYLFTWVEFKEICQKKFQ